jgi:hypothetical protein
MKKSIFSFNFSKKQANHLSTKNLLVFFLKPISAAAAWNFAQYGFEKIGDNGLILKNYQLTILGQLQYQLVEYADYSHNEGILYKISDIQLRHIKTKTNAQSSEVELTNKVTFRQGRITHTIGITDKQWELAIKL